MADEDAAPRAKPIWARFLTASLVIIVSVATATSISILVYIIVFGKFANFPRGDLPYPALVIGGVLPMQYFVSSLTTSSMSLAINLQLVTKVYFPRLILPVASVAVATIDVVPPAVPRIMNSTRPVGSTSSSTCDNGTSSAPVSAASNSELGSFWPRSISEM